MRKCFYCGNKMHRPDKRRKRRGPRNPLERTEDHLTPRSRGGHRFKDDIFGGSNIVYCHRKCNEEKGDKTVDEYRAVVAARKGIPVEEFKFPGEETQ